MKISYTIDKLISRIGGLKKGDSILFIASEVNNLNFAVSPLLIHFIENNYSIIIITTRNLSDFAYLKSKNVVFLRFEDINFNSFANSIKKYVHKTKNFVVFIDDISNIKNYGYHTKKIIKVYQNISNYTQRKKWVLLSTLQYSKFSNFEIGLIKDLYTATLGVFKLGDDYFVNVINLKNQYIPENIFPLKLKTSKVDSTQLIADYKEIKLDSLERQIPIEFINTELYQQSFLNSNIPMFIFEWNGDFIKPNKKILSLTGLDSEEFNILNIFNLVNQTEKFKVLRNLAQLKEKKSIIFKLNIQVKSSKNIPVEVNINEIKNKFYLASVRSISEELQVEKKLTAETRKYLKYLDSVALPVIIFKDKTCVYANSSFYEFIGVSAQDIIEQFNLNNLFDKNQYRKIRAIVNKLPNDEKYFYPEVHIETKTQKSRICDIIITKFHLGTQQLLQLTIYDVTSRIKLIETLKDTTNQYKQIFEVSNNALAIYGDGIYKNCNKAFLNFFEISSLEEIIGKGKSFIGIEENEIIYESSKKKKSTISVKRFKLKKEDDSEIFIEASSIPIIYEGANCELEFYRDVTNEIKLEYELNQKIKENEFINKIIQITNEDIQIEKLTINTLEKVISYLKWECGGFYVKNDKDFNLVTHSGIPLDLTQQISKLDIYEGIGGLVSKTQKPHIFKTKNYPTYLPHKRNFERHKFNIIALIPTVHKNTANGFILLASTGQVPMDINSESLLTSIGAHIGNALHNSIKLNEVSNLLYKYEKLLSSISDVIYYGNPSNMFSFISPNVESLTGYTVKDFQRNKSILLSIIHPDDRKILLSRIANINDIKENDVIEYRLLPRGKAEYIWVRDSINVIKNEAGVVETVYGILSDITEKKNLEVTLRNTEQFKSGILAGIREGVIVLDNEYNFLDWNDAMEKITGLPRAEILGRNIFEITDIFGKNLTYYLEQALAGQVVSTEDIQYKIPFTGKEGYFWGKFAPLRDNKNSIVGIVAIISDITKRKKLEEEIKYSEQLQRNVIDTIGDFFVLTDLTGKVLQVNKEFINTLGYDRSEAIGQEFPYPWLIEEEMSRFVIWVSNLRSKNYLHDFDMTWQTKDGKRISISLNTTLLRNSLGEPIAMLNLARNITERKKLAQDLEERNKLIESINSIIQTANQTTDFEKIFRVFADNIFSIVPFDKIDATIFQNQRIEIFGSIIKEYNSFESGIAQEIDNHISKITKITKKPVLISDSNEDERLIIHSILEDQYLSIISFPIYSEGEILGTINIYSKEANSFEEELINKLKPFIEQMGAIIDRILLFRKVTNDATYIHNLLNSIDKIVFTVDDEFKLREVNKAWYRFIERLYLKPKTSYVGKYLFDELPENILGTEIFQTAKAILENKRNYASLEFEIKLNQDTTYDYLLTINPMIIEGKVTGEVFTLTDITDLKRTENALKILNKQLIDLNDISTHISSSFDINKIFETALPRITRLLSADYLFIWFTNPEDLQELILKSKYNAQDNSLELCNIKINIQNWDYRIPTYASTWHDIPNSLKEILIEKFDLKIAALASVPIKSVDKVLGVFQIYYKNEHSFALQQDQLISMIGNQLGTAMDNAQLYSTLQSQLNRLSILYELSQQLTATLDIDQMFEIIHSQLVKIVDFDEMMVKFIDEIKLHETTMFHVKSIGNEKIYIPRIMQSVQIQINSPIWEIINEMKTIKYENSSGQIFFYFPLASKNNIIGTLILKPKDYTYYGEAEIAMIENVCSLVSIAIEKTKLYEETVQKSNEIQRRNKELDDFTYVVSHDLKEPLISIEGYSQILREEFKELFNGEPAEYIESIVKATGRMKNLIDDLLTLSRISRISESFKAVTLESIIKEVETDLSYALNSKKIRLIKPNLLPVLYGNETQLKMVFRNLVSNSIKFSDKPDPFIEIGCKDYDDDYYLCFVRDNGIGIEEKYFEKIFIIFQRLHSREEYEGTGAGLAIVKKIIEIHKGKIWVESKPGEGSTFYFTLQKYKNQE